MKRGWCASLLLALVMPVVMVGCGGGKRPYVPLSEENLEQDFALTVMQPAYQRVYVTPGSTSGEAVVRVTWQANSRPVTMSLQWGSAAPCDFEALSDQGVLQPSSGGVSYRFRVRAPVSAPPGRYQLMVVGQDGIRTRAVSFQIYVRGYRITVPEPRSFTVGYPGAPARYTVRVIPVNGFGGLVYLKTSGVPTDAFYELWSSQSVDLVDEEPQVVWVQLDPRLRLVDPVHFTVVGTSGSLSAISETCTLTVR